MSHMPLAIRHKLLAIIGSTATGKTSLAVKLSKLFPSVLVSADSRQVYRGLDIVTGKDHPTGLKLHGLDLVNPDEACSVAVWTRAVTPIIHEAWGRGVLPIVVGGTGLFFRSLLTGIPTMDVPPNPILRQQLETLSVTELQSRLKKLSPDKLGRMNNSDLHNPRRLIRAIEVAISSSSLSVHKPLAISHKPLIIGLKPLEPDKYRELIKTRVIKRLKLGAVKETKQLLRKYPPSLPAFTSLGYRYLIRYLDGQLTKSELIKAWTREEFAYAKRQLTWFTKIPGIHWFDPQSSSTPAQVATLVKDWYSK